MCFLDFIIAWQPTVFHNFLYMVCARNTSRYEGGPCTFTYYGERMGGESSIVHFGFTCETFLTQKSCMNGQNMYTVSVILSYSGLLLLLLRHILWKNILSIALARDRPAFLRGQHFLLFIGATLQFHLKASTVN